MDWQKDVAGGAQEFVESLKTDIFQDQVYVFTPKGEIKELPSGATPLDFAYRIHTDVGHHCVGAKVNGRLVPLDYQLQNGDIVEIITAKGSRGPSRDWLNPNLGYVTTAHAREKIRQWFRKQQREENIVARPRAGREGAQAPRRRRRQAGRPGRRLPASTRSTTSWPRSATATSTPTRSAVHVLAGAEEQRKDSNVDARSSRGPSTPTAACACWAWATCSRAWLAAATPCPATTSSATSRAAEASRCTARTAASVLNEDEKDRLVSVDWGESDQHVFPVTVRVEAWDREGLVRDVTGILADEKVNITALSAVVHKDQTATVWVTVEVPRLDRLSRIMSRLESIRDVFNVVREVGAAGRPRLVADQLDACDPRVVAVALAHHVQLAQDVRHGRVVLRLLEVDLVSAARCRAATGPRGPAALNGSRGSSSRSRPATGSRTTRPVLRRSACSIIGYSEPSWPPPESSA